MRGHETSYITLDEWIHLGSQILEVDPATLLRIADLRLADSALHAPAAGLGDTDAYPALIDKAAVLGWHLANNHALPDGNKRTAFVSTIVLLRRNGQGWVRPDTDDAVQIMVGVATKTIDIEGFATWLRDHLE